MINIKPYKHKEYIIVSSHPTGIWLVFQQGFY